jgi:hypothetical protein
MAGEILDGRPKATGLGHANMVAMNRSAANGSVSSPRRFILLPEEPVGAPRQAPRIRRYQLTSVGARAGRRRAGISNVDIATARIARELGRLGPLK